MESTGGTESTNVPTISTADISEELPNTDEGTFPSPENETQTVSVGLSVSALPSVLVATSQGLFTPEQLHEAGLKTTHFVIHDQAAIDTAVFKLKTPTTPLTPSPVCTPGTPLTPISAGITEKKLPGFKYNWEPSVHDPVLPVRCRNVCGELHKNRFGSGGRGKCIKVGESWYTPSEFEAICGRANSKDWKRSIRYAGRTLQCLIEDGVLQPHATSCTCTACCDDTTVSGPVRLFIPYKRKKRDKDDSLKKLHIHQEYSNSPVESPIIQECESEAVTLSTSGNETFPVMAASNTLVDESGGGTMIVTTAATPQTPVTGTTLDINEQRHWWQLEEMIKNLLRQVQELQKQVEAVKVQSVSAREVAVHQVKTQLEKEKKEALSTSRIEAQMNLSRAILEARMEKEIAVQQAVQQARVEILENQDNNSVEKTDTFKRCNNCNREAFHECTGCHRVSYCSVFCQRKDWTSHQEECGEMLVVEEGT